MPNERKPDWERKLAAGQFEEFSAEDHVQMELSFFDMFSTGLEPDYVSDRNRVIARKMVDYDLGRIGNDPHPLNLDDMSRDRLIASTREDAALAQLNSRWTLRSIETILMQLKFIRRMLIGLGSAIVLFIVGIVYYSYKTGIIKLE